MAPFSHREILTTGLRLSATEDAGSPVLSRFYEGYDRAFVLPNEREDLAGFRGCLALNASLPSLFGRRHSEQVLTVESAEGALIGGANFLATAMTQSRGPPVSIALNYVYIEAAARGRGLSRILIDAVQRMASLALTGHADGPASAVFIEQNDPLALSDAEYADDTEHAGIDQVDRLAVWARLGARLVDFAYVQPALSAEQDPDDGLIYAALRYPDETIPAAWFHDHLESFFGFSVRKGAPLAEDPVCAAQLAVLAARTEPVALVAVDRPIAMLQADRSLGAGQNFRQFATSLDK